MIFQEGLVKLPSGVTAFSPEIPQSKEKEKGLIDLLKALKLNMPGSDEEVDKAIKSAEKGDFDDALALLGDYMAMGPAKMRVLRPQSKKINNN